MSRRRESLLSGAGERSARRRLASLLGQKPICSTSNIRSTSEERCVGFPGAGESCAPAPGQLFAGAGERSHSFTFEEKCEGFPGAREAVSRRRESCFPVPKKGSLGKQPCCFSETARALEQKNASVFGTSDTGHDMSFLLLGILAGIIFCEDAFKVRGQLIETVEASHADTNTVNDWQLRYFRAACIHIAVYRRLRRVCLISIFT